MIELGIIFGLLLTAWSGWHTWRQMRQEQRRQYWSDARKHVESRQMIEHWQQYESDHLD